MWRSSTGNRLTNGWSQRGTSVAVHNSAPHAPNDRQRRLSTLSFNGAFKTTATGGTGDSLTWKYFGDSTGMLGLIGRSRTCIELARGLPLHPVREPLQRVGASVYPMGVVIRRSAPRNRQQIKSYHKTIKDDGDVVVITALNPRPLWPTHLLHADHQDREYSRWLTEAEKRSCSTSTVSGTDVRD